MCQIKMERGKFQTADLLGYDSYRKKKFASGELVSLQFNYVMPKNNFVDI